jgi:hypothetical protein
MKETLEEVAERILANNIDGLRDALKDDDLFFFYKGVIKCYGEAMAEWQQEQMYSEEEVLPLLEILQKCKEYFLLKTDLKSEERADAIGQVLETFKNK